MSGSRRKQSRHSEESEDRPPPRAPEEEGREAPAEPVGEEPASVGNKTVPSGKEAPSAPGAGAVPSETPEAAPAESRRESKDLKDRLQRLAADFSNYQKRMQRRLEEEKREAVRDLLRDLLPVLDNFDRALAAADESGDAEAFREGVRMVHDQLLEALARHGVVPIEAAGRRFDPEHHEAVAHVPSQEHPSGRVIDEVQRGYRHGEWTLRPSRVAVSRGPAEPEASESDEQGEAGAEDDASSRGRQTSRDREGADSAS